MSLLDVLRGGVKATAAARTGFLVGQDTEETTQRREGMQDAALKRQSRLDALAEQRAAAEEERNRAQAKWYRERPRTGANPANQPPHTVNSDEGIMQWDPVTRTFKSTGLHAPERASERAAARQEARDKRQGTKDALTGVERQISDTRAESKDALTDPAIDSDNALTTRLNELRQRTDSLGHVRDSLAAEVKVPGSGAAAMPKKAPVSLAPSPSAPNAASADYQRAADAYKQALKEGADPTEARALYNRAIGALARKHGQVK